MPFMVAFLIFPLRTSNRPLFESIMPAVVTLCVVIFANLYFRKLGKKFLKEGVLLGILWLVISLVIDLLLFMKGPMAMPLVDYMADIGLTYLIIPTVTIGFGFMMRKK